jgi:hypothetical protein
MCYSLSHTLSPHPLPAHTALRANII